MRATPAVNQNRLHVRPDSPRQAAAGRWQIAAEGRFSVGLPTCIEQNVTPDVLIALHAVKTLEGLCVPIMLPVTCRAVEQPGSSSGS